MLHALVDDRPDMAGRQGIEDRFTFPAVFDQFALFKGAQLMVPLQVSNLKKLDAAGTYFVVDELPASASHHEFVQATAAMNRRLEKFDLDEAEKVEDNNDNGEAIEEGNVVAEPQQPAEAPETPAPEDEAGE